MFPNDWLGYLIGGVLLLVASGILTESDSLACYWKDRQWREIGISCLQIPVALPACVAMAIIFSLSQAWGYILILSSRDSPRGLILRYEREGMSD